MSTETYTPWDSAELIDDDETALEYLQAALDERDPHVFAKAVGTVARARGMTAIAHDARVGRESLYKALSGDRDPRISTIMKVLTTLGVRLTVGQSIPAEKS